MMKLARWLALIALVMAPVPALAALQIYQYQAINSQSGVPMPGATVTIYLYNTTTKASIYDINGNPLSNPIVADFNGLATFLADSGSQYQIVFSSGAFTSTAIYILTNIGPTGTNGATICLLNSNCVVSGIWTFTQYAAITPTTYATGLAGSSTCSVKGQLWAVTDGASSIAWGSNISGGGTSYYLINCNGSNWTVVGK